jgi:hydrogenase maturation protease
LTTPELLILAYGNPGRGDDALGPAFLDTVAKLNLPQVECQSDMQLQVEHAMDMQGRSLVLFVDADVSCRAPFEFGEIEPVKDDSYTSHAMSPQALLHAYLQVFNKPAPVSFLLRIRGEQFELGDELSPSARAHLEEACRQLRPLWDDICIQHWRKFTVRLCRTAA